MLEKNCGFTGYRPSRFDFKYNEHHPDCMLLKQQLAGKIIQKCCLGVYNFFTGMAMGNDIWAAEAVLEAKRDFYNINLIAVVPFKNHIDSLMNSYVSRYENILNKCADVIYIADDYSNNAYLLRNKYIVDHCGSIIAVYDEKRNLARSGTSQTVNYSKRMGRDITYIVPGSLH